MSVISLIKPPMWALTPGLVAPEWQWVYAMAKGIWPLWQDFAEVQDSLVVRNLLQVPNTGGINSNDGAGAFVQFNNGPWGSEAFFTAADDTRIEFDEDASDSSPLDIKLTGECTVAFVHRNAGDYTTLQWIITSALSGSNVNFAIEFGRTNNRYTVLSGPASVDLTSSFNISDDNPRSLVARRKGGTSDWDLDLWINGTLDSSVTGVTNNPGLNASAELWFGGLKSRTANFTDGSLSSVILFDQALSDGACAALSSDPFGPFRMADEARVVYALAAAAVVDVLGPYGQQQPVIEVVEVVGY